MAKQVPARNGGTLTRPEKGDPGGPGRPPRLLTTIVKELKEKGYTRVSASNVCDAFETLMDVPEEELKAMVSDPKSPMSLRIVGKAMLTAKGWEVLQAMLDRAHGRARQQHDLTSGGEKLASQIIGLQITPRPKDE